MNDVYVSVMAQYFPTYKAKEDESIARKINQKEYDEIEAYLEELDLKGYENRKVNELSAIIEFLSILSGLIKGSSP